MLGRILGLDLGSHELKGVELRQTLRGVELVRLYAVPVEAPAPAEAPAQAADEAGVDETPAPLAPELETLRRWAESQDLAGVRVICALPGDRVTRRLLQLPFRDKRRIAQVVPFEIESETPFDLDDVFVDWELVGSGRTSADVVATVAPRADVVRRAEGLRAAGVEPRVLEAEGLVLGNLASWIELPGTRLLVEIGHRKTTLCLVAEGHPRAARSIAIGGRHLTEALARERGIPFAEAERIKCRDGVAGSAAAGRVLDRLARELVRSLGSLESALGGPVEKTLDGLVLLGGGARLARLDAFLTERTGVPAARLAVPPGPATAAFLAAGDPLRFAPALALALRGSLQARTRTNFLQGDLAPRLDLRRTLGRFRSTVILAGVALVLAGIAGGSRLALEARRADRLEAELAAIWTEAAPGRPVPEAVPRALQDQLREVKQRADLLGIYGGNLSALDLLARISALVPKDLAVIFEELSIDGQVVRIRGHTPSFAAVDQLRAALAEEERFGDIRVSEIQADAARGGNTFSVTISLAQGDAS